ncbi:unnamed protein product [Absidia cylindrospora]
MDKTSNTTKPSKPAIGSKLQRNPFLAKEQSNSDNLDNQKPSPVKKKTTTPAWLQKSEFASSKRASLQKMSQKVSSNPWKKTTTASDNKSTTGHASSGSKLPTLSTSSSKPSSLLSSSSPAKASKAPTSLASTRAPVATKIIPTSKLSTNKGPRTSVESAKGTSKIQQQSQSSQKLETSTKKLQQQTTEIITTGNIDKTNTTEAVTSTTTRVSIIKENPATDPKLESLPTKPTSRLYDSTNIDNMIPTSESVSNINDKIDIAPSHVSEPDTHTTTSITADDDQTSTNSLTPPALAPSHSPLQSQPLDADSLPAPIPSPSPSPSPSTSPSPSPTQSLSITTPSQVMSKSTSVSSSTSDLLSELLSPPEPSSLAGTDITTAKNDIDAHSSIGFDTSATPYRQHHETLPNNNRDSVFDVVLPWSQHSQEQIQQANKQQNFGTITLDYDTFFQQLVVSHAISSSLFFPTVSFDQAQKLQKKHLKSNDHIDMIGTRLLMETKAQRMILAMHKLSTHTPSSTNSASSVSTVIPSSVEEKESDRLDQVDRLVEELIQWMHRDYSRREQYLQHLAGTLAQQCTHLEQINHSITMESSSSFSISTTPTDHTMMMKKETQWILALRQEIIQLFEHHLPSVTLPSLSTSTPQHTIPQLSTSYSASTKSMSPSSSSSHISASGLGNEDDGDAFYNSNRTSMTSMMTDQQAHIYHRHHQNIVQEMKQFIQLLDQQLATLDISTRKIPQHQQDSDSRGHSEPMYERDAAKTIGELEASLKNERQHNESLATKMTDLQQRWDQEVQHRQALHESQQNQENEHQLLVKQLKLALEQQEMQHNLKMKSGASEWNQEHQQQVNQLTLELDEEKRQRQALEVQWNSHQQYQDQQQNELKQEKLCSADLRSRLMQLQQANDEKQKQLDELNGVLNKQNHHTLALESQLAQLQQDQVTLANQYSYNDSGNGDTTLEIALIQLSKERDEARLETQEWQTRVQGMESKLHDQQVKVDGLVAELLTKDKALETLHSDKSTSELQVGTLESQLHHLQAEHEELQRGHGHQQELSKDSEHRLAEATHHIHSLTEQMADLKIQHQQHLEKQQHEMENIGNQNEQEDWKKKYLDLEDRLEKAQQQFTHRESGYLLQSASLEAELEQILKEYDRLTRHIMDFNSERKKYEEQISDMTQHQHRLDQQLADLQVLVLGMNDSQGTTKAVRMEFRQLMAQTKATHQQQLDKELQLRSTLEQERRDEKQEQERLRWDRVNVSVQTHFVV